MNLSRAVTLAVLAATIASTASAQSPEATLGRAVDAYRQARTVSVKFTQTVTNPLTQRSMSSSGELLRKRPNLLSITFTSPASDRIVADGSTLWVYLPSSAPGQVIRMPAAGQSGMLLDPLGQVLSTPAREYDISSRGTARIGGRATHIVKLVPKSSHALFSEATLWIDDDNSVVRQVQLTETSGLIRKVTITSFRTNVSLRASAFRFVAPAGARIVDQHSLFSGQ